MLNSTQELVAIYRHEFQPSAQLAEPYVLAAANVVAADTTDDAERQHLQVLRSRVARFVARGRRLTVDEADQVLASPQGQQVAAMMRHTAVGTGPAVREQLESFALHADADELILVHAARSLDERLRSLDLVADVAGRS